MATEHLIDLERQSGVEGGLGVETLLGQSRYRNAASVDAGQIGGTWPANQGLAPRWHAPASCGVSRRA
jgi:hypothetical protein